MLDRWTAQSAGVEEGQGQKMLQEEEEEDGAITPVNTHTQKIQVIVVARYVYCTL